MISIVNPAAESGFGSKAILGLLSDKRNWHAYRTEEIAAIKAVIPWTQALESPSFFTCSMDTSQLVLKPAGDYGGAGVICGWEHSREDFEAFVAGAINSGRCYVLQERVDAEAVDLKVVTPDGRLLQGCGHPVMGIITIGGIPAAGLARSYIGSKTPGFINAHQGAAVGPAIFGELST